MSDDSPEAPASGATRRHVLLVLRIVVTLAAFAWILTHVDVAAIVDAARRVPIAAFALSCVLVAANLVVSATRWRAMLEAYGAVTIPHFARLVRLNFVGFFYNTWLPGGLGGDAVRGVASREAFGEHGATGALAVVFVERVLGLVGMLVVVAATSAVAPLPAGNQTAITWASVGGVAVGAIVIGALASGPRLAPFLPGPLKTIASRLPPIRRAGPFTVAVLLSLATQTLGAVTGHVIIHALAPDIAMTSSLVAIPLAMATAFLPFLVGGTGAREMVFVALYGPLGMSTADATAAGLLCYAGQLVVGLFGAFLRVEEKSPPQ
jgi:uncharacterized membrane protein YbhN (UPF0104 family)